MKEERMRILNMVAEGKVTPEEGARLIEALGDAGEQPAAQEPKGDQRKPRLFIVRVDDEKDNTKVRIALPLALADLALKFMPQDVRERLQMEHGVNITEVLHKVQEGLPEGKLVDVTSDTAKVEIAIE